MSFYDDASLVFLPSGGAGKDGKAYSMKPVPEYGSELVTNGGFDTDSDWIKETGWTISGGTANCDGSSNILRQTNAVPLNTKLYVSVEVSNYVSGTLQVKFAPVGYSLNVTKNGVYTIVTNGDNSVNDHIQIISISFIGSIDNVSVREVVVGDGDFTFSRGSNLTATRVDSNGLIEKGRENTQLYTNNLSNLSSNQYGKNEVLVSTAQADPFGNNDAVLLTPTTTNSYHRWYKLNATSVGVQTISLYAKPNGYTNIYAFCNANNQYATYSLVGSGSVITSSQNTIDSRIEQLSGGWYRISHTVNCSSTNWWGIYIGTGTAAYVGDGTSGVYFYGFQVEQGLVATEYIESGASSGLAGILEDSPRFDYSGGASCPSLLLEPSRTNLIGYSEYMAQSELSSYGTDVTHNATQSPSGKNSAALVYEESSNSQHYVLKGVTTSSSTTYTQSAFVKKKDSGIYASLRTNGVGGNSYIIFDFDTATIVDEGSDIISSGVVDYSNGWYRIHMTYTLATISFIAGITNSTTNPIPSYLGTGKGYYLWGAQVEQGSYPTSYIPNHSGGSVTRDADACSGAGDASTFNDDEGVLYAEIAALANDGGIRYLSLSDGGSNNRVVILFDSAADRIRAIVSSGGVKYFDENTESYDVLNYNKIAVRYKQDDFSLWVNGTNVASVSSGSSPIGLNELSYNLGGSNTIFSKSKQLIVFNTALSDTDCEILTGATSYESFSAMATALNYTTYE